MRVTDGAIFDGMKRNLGEARARAVESQTGVGDGKRVHKPSDDPTAFAEARKLKSRETLAHAGAQQAEAAHSMLGYADDSLNEAGNILADARDLVMHAISSPIGLAERQEVATAVDELRKQLLTVANAEVKGSYIFGGNADGSEPFASDGSFQGDAQTREIQPFPGMRMRANLPGGRAFGADQPNGIFTTLENIVTNLRADAPAAVRADLGNLDTGLQRVLSARGDVGAMMDSMEMAQSVTDRYAFDANAEGARLTQVNEIDAASDLMRAQNAYNAALAAAQRLPLRGLVGNGG